MKFAMIIAVATSLFSSTAQAANDSNRNEVRARIASGGWEVVWGVTINEAEYAKFMAATYNGNPLAYFSNYLDRNIDKFVRNAPGVARNGLKNAIIRSFKERGRGFRLGNVGVKAGLATYRRWYTVRVPNGTEKYKIHGPFGTWTWGYRPRFTEKRVPLPNHHQPYVSFRILR